MVDRPIKSDDFFGVGVYGRLLSKVRSDFIAGQVGNPEPQPILEANEYQDLYIFQARRYIAGDKAKFSGISNIKVGELRAAIGKALASNNNAIFEQEKMKSPVHIYGQKIAGQQRKDLYNTVHTNISLLPDLGRKTWVKVEYIRDKKDKKDVIPFRAIAKPLKTDAEVQEFDKYKRKKEGKALITMAPTVVADRIQARQYMFSLRITTVDLARIIHHLFPFTKKKDLVKFFKIGQNSLAQPFQTHNKEVPQTRQLTAALFLVLDCFVDVQWETKQYTDKVQELRLLLRLSLR
jgi:hypothetical protein